MRLTSAAKIQLLANKTVIGTLRELRKIWFETQNTIQKKGHLRAENEETNLEFEGVDVKIDYKNFPSILGNLSIFTSIISIID